MPATAEAPSAATSFDYAKLTRQQRLALFLIVIGAEAASGILKQFDDSEIETICREMSQFTIVSDELARNVLAEFSPIIGESVVSTLGGLGYARATVERARGDHKANVILTRAGAPVVSPATDVIKEISEMEGGQIFNLIKGEQPQTISFLLSYLGKEKAAEVFTFFTPELREEIAERLGTIDSTSTELVGKIVRNLGRHIDQRARPNYHQSGGVRAVADLLNGIGKEGTKNLLLRLEERNAPLGAAVRKKMFSFEDLLRLQAADLQRVLREVDSANLSISMKAASETLKEKIFGSISKRAAEALRDEISMLGPMRIKDVEAAQDTIIQVVRRLEDEGALSLDGDAAGVV